MISFDFEFYRPDSLDGAVSLYKELSVSGKKALYYAGGTEIVTSFRKESVTADALIDIKGIKECRQLSKEGDYLYFGSALTLNELVEKNYYPMLTEISRKVADHTVRNSLTIGGNICGRLPYREIVLAFMLAESTCLIATDIGVREVPFNEAYDKRLLLKDGEFLVAIKVKKTSVSKNYYRERKVKIGEIDYPIFHIVISEERGVLRAAFSGVTGFPIRSDELDKILSASKSHAEISEEIIANFPYPIREDIKASKAFRTKLLKDSIKDGLDYIGGASNE
ncbi:MAG: FAD binding domain-containing protein [Acidaminobacteraceae bacterium]